MDLPAELPEPWELIDNDALRLTILNELKQELGSQHTLYKMPLTAIGRRIDRDDVLMQLEDGSGYVIVHLTWAGRVEADPRWPITRYFDSWSDVFAQILCDGEWYR